MSDELKPCPFCGGEAVLRNVRMVGCTYAICSECGTQSEDASQDRAMANWNRRVDPSAELIAVAARMSIFIGTIANIPSGGLSITFTKHDAEWAAELLDAYHAAVASGRRDETSEDDDPEVFDPADPLSRLYEDEAGR